MMDIDNRSLSVVSLTSNKGECDMDLSNDDHSFTDEPRNKKTPIHSNLNPLHSSPKPLIIDMTSVPPTPVSVNENEDLSLSQKHERLKSMYYALMKEKSELSVKYKESKGRLKRFHQHDIDITKERNNLIKKNQSLEKENKLLKKGMSALSIQKDIIEKQLTKARTDLATNCKLNRKVMKMAIQETDIKWKVKLRKLSKENKKLKSTLPRLVNSLKIRRQEMSELSKFTSNFNQRFTSHIDQVSQELVKNVQQKFEIDEQKLEDERKIMNDQKMQIEKSDGQVMEMKEKCKEQLNQIVEQKKSEMDALRHEKREIENENSSLKESSLIKGQELIQLITSLRNKDEILAEKERQLAQIQYQLTSKVKSIL